jgi:hypothetical protein
LRHALGCAAHEARETHAIARERSARYTREIEHGRREVVADHRLRACRCLRRVPAPRDDQRYTNPSFPQRGLRPA